MGTTRQQNAKNTTSQASNLDPSWSNFFGGKPTPDLLAGYLFQINYSENLREIVLAQIKKNPKLLYSEATTMDSRCRLVKAKLLQIAAMAGEVFKDGYVDQLVKAGNLSKAEVAVQLHEIFSAEAMQQNTARKKVIFDIAIKFGEALINNHQKLLTSEISMKQFYDNKIKIDKDFRAALEDIDIKGNLERSNVAFTAGFLFDQAVIIDIYKWAHDNSTRFDAKDKRIFLVRISTEFFLMRNLCDPLSVADPYKDNCELLGRLVQERDERIQAYLHPTFAPSQSRGSCAVS
jgi:hypothetical protein